MSLPWRRMQQQPAGDAHDGVGLLAVSRPSNSLVQLADGAVAVEAHRVRVDARGPQRLDLRQPAVELARRRSWAVAHRFRSKTIRRP